MGIQQKTMAEMNSSELAACMLGLAGEQPQGYMMHILGLATKYKAKHPEYNMDNLEQVLKDYLGGRFDIVALE